MLVSRHHEAVGGFFGASQERAECTSFEGGSKCRETSKNGYTKYELGPV
jgi:hypothetical protein